MKSLCIWHLTSSNQKSHHVIEMTLGNIGNPMLLPYTYSYIYIYIQMSFYDN